MTPSNLKVKVFIWAQDLRTYSPSYSEAWWWRPEVKLYLCLEQEEMNTSIYLDIFFFLSLFILSRTQRLVLPHLGGPTTTNKFRSKNWCTKLLYLSLGLRKYRWLFCEKQNLLHFPHRIFSENAITDTFRAVCLNSPSCQGGNGN